MKRHRRAAVAFGLAATLLALPAVAQTPPAPPPAGPGQTPAALVPYEAVNRNEPEGDRLGAVRRLAALIVAQDKPNPKLIVDVGSFTGEFLEAFMQQFPQSHGQWTEPVDNNRDNSKRRLARFGSNVDYVIGCPSRDLSKGCVPKGVDVMLTSWLSIHQDLAGIRRFYKEAAPMLPSGGWIMNLDHITAGEKWDAIDKGARAAGAKLGIIAVTEGPPVHHPDFKTPTLEEQISAMKDAGITDVRVVWRRLNTILVMGRKP